MNLRHSNVTHTPPSTIAEVIEMNTTGNILLEIEIRCEQVTKIRSLNELSHHLIAN
jgi:hypothetical protein